MSGPGGGVPQRAERAFLADDGRFDDGRVHVRSSLRNDGRDRGEHAGRDGVGLAVGVDEHPPAGRREVAVRGPDLGVEVGTATQPARACKPGDNSPAGTVVDGYKKTVIPSPFGSMCRWEAVH